MTALEDWRRPRRFVFSSIVASGLYLSDGRETWPRLLSAFDRVRPGKSLMVYDSRNFARKMSEEAVLAIARPR